MYVHVGCLQFLEEKLGEDKIRHQKCRNRLYIANTKKNKGLYRLISIHGSFLVQGFSNSRCQQETLTRQTGSQGIVGLNAWGFGTGTARSWDCHRAQGPLCFLRKANCWEGGVIQMLVQSICVCGCPRMAFIFVF